MAEGGCWSCPKRWAAYRESNFDAVTTGESLNLLSISQTTLAEAVIDTRQRSLELLRDLDENQLLGPRLPIVNPLLWEMGHLAWFGEKWVLRHVGKIGRASCRERGETGRGAVGV